MQDHRIPLRWITDLLGALRVPYQAAGGLAARAHGATRALADLDFYVSSSRLPEIARAAGAHVVRPPSRHRDDCWDLVFMKIEYAGCEIELAGAEEARFFDRPAGEWRDAGIDFDASVEMQVLGVIVPVMPCAQLIAYKRALGREVDLKDLSEMGAARINPGTDDQEQGHADQ